MNHIMIACIRKSGELTRFSSVPIKPLAPRIVLPVWLLIAEPTNGVEFEDHNRLKEVAMTNLGDTERAESIAAEVKGLRSQINKRKEADKIIRKYTLYSMGAGLVPVPLIDIAAVTVVQIDMLKKLATLYGSDLDRSKGKAFASALAGSTLARVGASIVKAIPGIGTVIGGLSMSVLSGASTYGVGKVATDIFDSGSDLTTANMEAAKEAYKQQFEQGKQFVSSLRQDDEDVFRALERLSELRQKDVISEEDFLAQKQKLLDRL